MISIYCMIWAVARGNLWGSSYSMPFLKRRLPLAGKAGPKWSERSMRLICSFNWNVACPWGSSASSRLGNHQGYPKPSRAHVHPFNTARKGPCLQLPQYASDDFNPWSLSCIITSRCRLVGGTNIWYLSFFLWTRLRISGWKLLHKLINPKSRLSIKNSR